MWRKVSLVASALAVAFVTAPFGALATNPALPDVAFPERALPRTDGAPFRPATPAEADALPLLDTLAPRDLAPARAVHGSLATGPLPEARAPFQARAPRLAPGTDASLLPAPEPAAGREARAPIVILSDADFTPANGVRGGDGSPENPYVISDWNVPSVSRRWGGIHVRDVTAHFVIRNVNVVQLAPDEGAPCRSPVTPILRGENPTQNPALDPQNDVDCVRNTRDYVLGDFTSSETFLYHGLAEGSDGYVVLPTFAIDVRDAASARFENVVAGDVWVARCGACSAVGGEYSLFFVEDAPGFLFAENTFANFEIWGLNVDGARVVDNVRPHWVQYYSSIAIFSGAGCAHEVARNDVRGEGDVVIVDCYGPGRVTVRDNTFDYSAGCSGWGGQAIAVAAEGDVVIERNAGRCASVRYAQSARICDNAITGFTSVEAVWHAEFCRNTVTEGGFAHVDHYYAIVPGTTTRVHNNTFTNGKAGGGIWVVGAQGIEDARFEDNVMYGAYAVSAISGSRWARNTVRGSEIESVCRFGSPGACRGGAFEFVGNAVEGSKGANVQDCATGRVAGNTFRGTVRAVRVANCASASVEGNKIEDAAGGISVSADAFTVADNHVAGGSGALSLAMAPHARVTGNEIVGAREAFALDARGADPRSRFAGADFSGTTIDGRSVRVLRDCGQAEVDAALPGAAYLALLGCAEATLGGAGGLHGVLLAGTSRVSVQGNAFDAPAVALTDLATVETRFEGNTVTGAGLGVLSYDATRLAVSGNGFTFPRLVGVVTYRAVSPALEGNAFEGSDGIVTHWGSNVRIEGNTFRDGRMDVDVYQPAGATIRGNDHRGTLRTAIWIGWPSAPAAIEENTIVGANYGIHAEKHVGTVARNLVLGDYSGDMSADVADLRSVITTQYGYARPLGGGLVFTEGGAPLVTGNVVAGHRVGVFSVGWYYTDYTADVRDNVVRDNLYGFYHVNEQHAKIRGNTIERNGVGYYATCVGATYTCDASFVGNRFVANAGPALHLYRTDVTSPIEGNDFAGNAVGLLRDDYLEINAVLPARGCTGGGNWWGHESGPSVEWNPGGRGDRLYCVARGAHPVVTARGDWLIAPAPGAGASAPQAPAVTASPLAPVSGAPVALAAALARPADVFWSFGDGHVAGWGAARSASHAYAHGDRTYPATVVAREPDGRLSTATIPLAVTSRAPSLALAWTGAGVVGAPVRFAAAYDGEVGPVSFSWDFGAGAPAATTRWSATSGPLFSGALYFGGVGGGASVSAKGALNRMGPEAPETPVSQVWQSVASQYVWYGDGSEVPSDDILAGYSSGPTWVYRGPIAARGDGLLTFWASSATDGVQIDDFRVTLYVDGVARAAWITPGATLGVAPTKVQVALPGLRFSAQESLRLSVGTDWLKLGRSAFTVYYNSTLHPSNLLLGAAPTAAATAADGEAAGLLSARALDLGLLDALERGSAEAVPVLVDVRGSPEARASALLAIGATEARAFAHVNAVAATLPRAAMGALAALPWVEKVWADAPAEFLGTPSALGVSRVPEARAALGLTGKGVTAAVIDGGFVTDHPDLAGKFKAVVNLSDNFRPYPLGDFHGTATTGILAGRHVGVAPDADLVGIRVGHVNGFDGPPMSQVMRAMEWALDHKERYGIRVLSMSLGAACWQSVCDGTSPQSRLANALVDGGLVVVASAGNQGASQSIVTPADAEKAIAVGALDWKGTDAFADDEVAAFSSRGPAGAFEKPEVVAPGVGVRAPFYDNDYQDFAGTSAAAPFVAGIAAMLLEANPQLTPLEVRALLVTTARDLDEAGWDPASGHGVADALAAAEALHSTATLSPDHAYAAPGIYTARVSVVDARGVAATASVAVPVASAPGFPVAHFSAPTASVRAGEAIALSDASADANGGIVSRLWDFGDGTTAKNASVSHAWSAPGTYRVSLTVTNALGNSDAVDATVTVTETGAITTWYFHGTPNGPTVSGFFNCLVCVRDNVMDERAPALPAPKAWTVLRTRSVGPPAASDGVGAVSWELRDTPVHVKGDLAVTLWAGTKQGGLLWVDSYFVGLYADGALAAWREIPGSTLANVPTELRFVLPGVDARATSRLLLVVAPKVHQEAWAQGWTDLFEPVTFYYDATTMPSRAEARIAP